MGFQIRLKTGFYQTGVYELVICNGTLFFMPKEHGDCKVELKGEDILNITFESEKSIAIEMQTRNGTYQGILCNENDFEQMLELLKQNLHKKIICEYKGGEGNE